jgi:DNA uptake protein ComE-like DNA-binding protein
MWTLNQRKALLLLCVLLGLFLTVEAYRNQKLIADPSAGDGPRSSEIEDRIDPNVADADALAAIPSVGEKRAVEIVAYRDEFHRQHPDQKAFRSVDDFLLLKGFGDATAANLRPYLLFNTDPTGLK